MHLLIILLFLSFTSGNQQTIDHNSISFENCNCELVADTLFVTHSTDSGDGSFRCALECAALTTGKEIIAFNLLPGQDSLVQLVSTLPAIPSNTWIVNQNEVIIIDGGQLNNEGDFGLRIVGDSIIIKGLTIQNFPNNAIDNYQGHREILIENNRILNNGRLSPSGDGIDFRLAENFIIRKNTIIGNKKDGIILHGCSNADLWGNDISYNQKSGINIYNGSNIQLGGNCTDCGNILTGNLEHGVKAWQNSSHLAFYNNYIGINSVDIPAIPNGLNGIFLSNCDTVIIGKTNAGNFISGNISSGIKVIDSSHHISINNNTIGISTIHELGLPNGMNGIEILNSFHISIGDESSANANLIGYQPNHVYIGDSSQYCSILSNVFRCSINGIMIIPGSNMNVLPADDFEIISSTKINGFSTSPETIQAYRKDSNCSSCQGNYYLGSVETNGSEWTMDLNTPLQVGDEVSLLKTDTLGNTSTFSLCKSYECEPYEVQILPVGQEHICENGSLVLETNLGEQFMWNTGETTPSITITEAGEYTVQVWNEHDCPSGFDSIYIPTIAAPNLSITPSDSTVFCGDYTILSASGLGNFEWNNGETGPIVLAEESGYYCVSLTNQYNCVSTECVPVTKGEKVQAEIAVIGDTIFCSDNPVMLKASGGSKYEWSIENSSDESILVSESGTYSVMVTNEYGCIDSTSQTINFHPAVEAYILPSGYQLICPGDSLELTAYGGDNYLWNTTDQSENITVTNWGVFSVTVTNDFGCSDVVTQSVAVKPRIDVNIIEENPLEICENEEVWLHANYDIMDSIVWNQHFPADSILITESGKYIVEIFNLGCSENDSIDVAVLPKPDRVDSITGPSWSYPDSIQVFQILQYDPLLEYLWEVDGGLMLSSTNESIEVQWERDDFGLVCVTAIDSNGCESEAYCRMIDLAPLDIQSIKKGQVYIYPNPARGSINVQTNAEYAEESLTLEFYNPSGMLVGKKSLEFSRGNITKKLDVSDIPGGIYWVKIELGQQQVVFEKILLNQ